MDLDLVYLPVFFYGKKKKITILYKIDVYEKQHCQGETENLSFFISYQYDLAFCNIVERTKGKGKRNILKSLHQFLVFRLNHILFWKTYIKEDSFLVLSNSFHCLIAHSM